MKKQPKITILDNGYNCFRTRCEKCGCEFEYDIKSLKRRKKYYFVKCPICGNICRHSLTSNIRKDDVLAKYKKQIRVDLEKELVPKIANNMIFCVRRNIKVGPDYELLTKWWENQSEYLKEYYEYQDPFGRTYEY